MWKVILAGTTALTVAGASLVYAQQTPPAQPGGRDGGPRFARLTPDQRAALIDARIAGLKAGLKLTPAQEKNWPAVETALRERAKQRADRMDEFMKMREQRRANPDQRGDVLERMKSRADRMTEAASNMRKLTDAIDPLYKSFDESQKQRFAILYRDGGERRHFHRGFQGPGPGMDNAPPTPNRPGPGQRQRRTELQDNEL